MYRYGNAIVLANRDFDDWWAKGSSGSPGTSPQGEGMTMHDNAAFSRNSSGIPEVAMPGDDNAEALLVSASLRGSGVRRFSDGSTDALSVPATARDGRHTSGQDGNTGALLLAATAKGDEQKDAKANLTKQEVEGATQAEINAVADASRSVKAEMGVAAPPEEIPTTPVGVEVWHMGQHTFRGASEKIILCQGFPTSLSSRRHGYMDSCIRGKGVCSKKDDSLGLSAQVLLPDVLHLPLSAEPPLCLNVMAARIPSSTTAGRHMSMSHPRASGRI